MKKFFCISLALFFVLTLGVVNAQEASASEGVAIEASEEATPLTAAEMSALTDAELKKYLEGCNSEQFAKAIAIATESGDRALARRVLLIANKILQEVLNNELLVALDKISPAVGGDDPVPPPPPPRSGRSTRIR